MGHGFKSRMAHYAEFRANIIKDFKEEIIMYRFVEKRTGKVWTEKAATYAEARAKILKILGYKSNTQITKAPMNTYVIG